jgi:hypothetical protein
MQEQKIRCYHCGNLAISRLVFSDGFEVLKDEVDNEQGDIEKIFGEYKFHIYKCTACDGLNLLGGFVENSYGEKDDGGRLYPPGPHIVPPRHHWPDKTPPIPQKLTKIYEEIWHLKHQVPNAFGNQIRRCLEYICSDKKAEGKSLNEKLLFLHKEGYLPGAYKDISHIIRMIGNVGSHLTERELDYWDVELLDEFFRILVDYVYVIPAKLARMKQRLGG